MKITKNISFTITLLFIFSLNFLSCSKSNFIETEKGKKININEATITRATSSHFEEGDKLSISFIKTGRDIGVDEIYSKNVKWNKDETSKFHSETDIYFPKGYNLDLYSYYPYMSNINMSSQIFNVDLDQSTPKNGDILGGYEQSDFLYDFISNKNKNNNPISLSFTHILSRIIVKISLDEGFNGEFPNITSIIIPNVATETTLNLSLKSNDNIAQKISNPTSTNEIKAKLNISKDESNNINGISAEAIVVPQSLQSGEQIIKIVTPTYTYKAKLNNNFDFDATKSYIFNVKLFSDKKIEITSINNGDWNIIESEDDPEITEDVYYDFNNNSPDYSESNIYYVIDQTTNDKIAVICKEYIPAISDEIINVFYNLDEYGNINGKIGYATTETGIVKVEFYNGNNNETIIKATHTNKTHLYYTSYHKFILGNENSVSLKSSPKYEAWTITDVRQPAKPPYLGTSEYNNREEYIYGLIKIGNQIWLKNNLKSTKLSNGYGLNIGRVDGNINGTLYYEWWAGWYQRRMPSCSVYGDLKYGAYSLTGSRKDKSELTELNIKHQKYGILYNFYTINAGNSIEYKDLPLPEELKIDFSLAPNIFRGEKIENNRLINIPSKNDWHKMIKYVCTEPSTSYIQPGESFTKTIEGKTTINSGEELNYTFSTDLLNLIGFNLQNGGYIEYTPVNNAIYRNNQFIGLDKSNGFWTREESGLNKAWSICSYSTEGESSETDINLKLTETHIRHGLSVRLKIDIDVDIYSE